MFKYILQLQVPRELKLVRLYLVDSIVKNLPLIGNYRELFGNRLDKIYLHVFQRVIATLSFFAFFVFIARQSMVMQFTLRIREENGVKQQQQEREIKKSARVGFRVSILRPSNCC